MERGIKYRDKSLFEAIVEYSHDGILLVDQELKINYANTTFQNMLGYDAGQINRSNLISFIHKEDVNFVRKLMSFSEPSSETLIKAEYRILTKENQVKWVKMIADNQLNNPEIRGLVINIYDITGIKQDHEYLHQLAFHDTLNGVANRTLFRDRLKHALAFAKRNNKYAAIISIDIDLYNTPYTLSTELENKLLEKVSEKIVKSLRETDTVSRQGNDEFLVVLNDIVKEQDAISVANKLHENLTQEIYLEGIGFKLTPFIGLSIFPIDARNSEQLITYADIAMSEAKNLSRNIVRLRSKDIRKPVFIKNN